MLGDGLDVVNGAIAVALAATPGLEFTDGKLRVKVAAPIGRDATGVHLDFGTGLQNDAGVLKTKDSEIVHDDLSGVHQDVNTTATPTFAGVNISTIDALPDPAVAGRVVRLSGDDRIYYGLTV